jgi:hypothetical protein
MSISVIGKDGTGIATVTNGVPVFTGTAASPASVGASRMFSENDAGSITGTATLLSPETTNDFRLRTVNDTILDDEVFCYGNQNTGKHSYAASTMTMALVGNALVTNNGNITTLNTATFFRTQQYFELCGSQSATTVVFEAAFSAALTTNTTIDFGMFLQSGTAPYAPTDGVYFRLTAAGFEGVINFNGVEFSTALALGSPPYNINQVYGYKIVINTDKVQFWVNNVLCGTLLTQVANGAPFASQTLPLQIRHAIGATAAGAALSMRVFSYSIQVNDQINLPYQHIASMRGNSAQIQQGGTTGGQLNFFFAGSEPTAGTLTSNTSPAVNNLGGLFLLPTGITPAASDYPLFAWQNPIGTVAVPGKVFVCTGVIIGELSVTTALTGGPLLFQWAIGYGSTAASLATGESTTFTAGGTTKIARKIPLGAQSLPAAAAVGTLSPGFQRDFDSAPLPVNPGEFLHIILRIPAGTATTNGAPRGSVAVLGYFR